MSFLASGTCASALNYSSRSSNHRDPTHKCLLRFSDEFLDPSDDISQWYSVQPYRRFTTLQYRKENIGVRHEFILILLQGEEGSEIKSHCRLERMGDDERLFQTTYADGTISKDYTHAIPLDIPGSAELTHNSDVVIEITFPIAFDLRDVLAICSGISKHKMAKRYTLLQYNCYFFSWTIVLMLARACLRWDVDGVSLESHIQNIQEGIIRTIDEQGPTRFHDLAYILSKSTPICHENGGEHPLDRAIRSGIRSREFAGSITEAVHGLLWVGTFPARLVTALGEVIQTIAAESFGLLSLGEPQHGETEVLDEQSTRGIDPKIRSTIRKATEKAMIRGAENSITIACRAHHEVTQDATILRQRMGSRVWYRCARRSIVHILHIGLTASGRRGEPPGSHWPRTRESSTRDYLLITPSVILIIGFRLALTFGFSLGTTIMDSFMKYRIRRHGGQNRSYLMARAVASIVGRGVLAIPKAWAFSKQYQYALATIHAANHEHMGETFDAHRIFDGDENARWNVCLESWAPALEILNNSLQALKADDEPYSSILRRDILDGLRDLGKVSLDLNEMWKVILMQHARGIAQTAHRELRGTVESGSTATLFEIAGGKGTLKAGERLTPHPFDEIEGSSVPRQDASSWSYDKLQQFIRERITLLSKRETEFAPALKHIPYIQPPGRCQTQIEATMEEIWKSCRSLMISRPK